MKQKFGKKVRHTSIGGQAVLEGVMMKGAKSVATAVRTETGEITVESKRVKSIKDKSVFYRVPFVRGVLNLGSQLFSGTALLMRSAEVYGDFAEPSKSDKWIADKLKINPMNLVLGISVVLGLVLAIALFMLLPNFLTGLIFEIPELNSSPLSALWYSLIEGGIMIVIFIIYILLVSLMKDIRRVFMYHGAEHKVINCYEYGLDLTVENAKKMSTQHSRCGTTFTFFVLMVSIFMFALVNWALQELGWLVPTEQKGASIINAFIKLPCKLIFVPIVAGISYELLKLLAKFENPVANFLRAPGMWLQKLTTKEPDDSMLEVSLTAFKTVMAMDEDDTIPETQFKIEIKADNVKNRLKEYLPECDESDIEWLLVEVTGAKRSELHSTTLSKEQYFKAYEFANKMKGGMPLQYAIGNTEFYGEKLSVNQSVLIPRPETELLVDFVVKDLLKDKNGANVLDICTGSGAIAIAIAKNCDAKVTASDISSAAIEVAKANAINAGAKIEFLIGDLFEKIDGQFDIITINPPYIKTSVIDTLDRKVKDFEPKMALDGGVDGLDFYKRIRNEFEKYLSETGTLVMEIGFDQADDIKGIFADFNAEIKKDFDGNDRIAVVTRKL